MLFDQGNQRSYIKKSSAASMNLPTVGELSLRNSLFGGSLTEVKKHTIYKVKLESVSGRGVRELELLDENKICGEIPRIPQGPWIEELAKKNIILTDFNSENPEIEILIGADVEPSLLTGKSLKLKSGLAAFETVFGWTIMGPTPQIEESSAMLVTSLMVHEDVPKELWSLETIGIRDLVESLSRKEKEDAAKEHFLNTVSRLDDGRYSVSLPWIEGVQRIPDNRHIAEKRLLSCTNTLLKAGKFKDYDDIFNAWVSEGIIETVNENEINMPCHFIPHRAIFKYDSATTPIRPVFDASCKIGRNPSLNDCMEKGPNLIELLPFNLLRFRWGKYGVIADIRKAFLMIVINENDRNYLCFLWWDNYEKKTYKIYRHNRVVFGVTCSPFLLAAVLEHHLSSVEGERKFIADKLKKSLYVDNCVTSVNSLEEFEDFKKKSTELLAEAGMELRQWECNFGEVSGIDQLSGSRCGLEIGKITTQEETDVSVLGIKWNKVDDSLSCSIPSIDQSEKITKRSVLSNVQKYFDPLGFYCPVLLIPKLILQKAWKSKSNWDQDLQEELVKEFEKWKSDMPILSEIKIPRSVTSGESSKENFQFHVFCDASKYAYATVVFLRVDTGPEIKVQLVQAKARVAPIKEMTIPRLELLACTIGSRLASSIKKALDLEEVATYYWSDSMTVLAWIKRSNIWGTFVGNRVREICQLTEENYWRHVPGSMNPADLPSRGCTARQLKESRWWLGPDWLSRSFDEWPTVEIEIDEEAVMAEKKKSVITSLASAGDEIPWYLKRYPSFDKNVVVFAWIRRFINKVKKKEDTESGQITVNELDAAEKEMFLCVQREVFPRKGDFISGIRVKREKSGLIRVMTKLLHRDDTENFRLPVLLPHTHPLVSRLINEVHIDNGHAGVQFLMSKIREKCWIIQGRKAIRKVVTSCVVCRRYTAKNFQSVPVSLPEDRIKNCKVFEVVGVDLAGPLFLKDGTKTWAVLFTCAVYRCVHLELVTSLSTEAFLWSFQRFIDRRGKPSTVYSDNGTNFVGAVNLFKSLDWSKIEEEAQHKRIQWKFNPPSASWWGGFWERLIGTMKNLLKRILGSSKLGYEELNTVLCHVESIINGRPLTFVTEDTEDLIPLTPAMFLQDNIDTESPEIEQVDAVGFQTRYKYKMKLREEFRSRFRKEYLSQLVQRGKEKKIVEVKLGDVVLIGADNKKRQNWPIGKIIELLPGKDKVVRVAKVRTASGELLRPIQRLYSLEVPSDESLPVSSESKEKATKKAKKKAEEVKKLPESEVVTRAGRKVNKPNWLGI